MDIFGFLSLIGGLALFLYGMNVMGGGLEKLSGGKLERILENLTSNPLKAVLLGAGVTAVIQSSSATTVMLVGFVNSGIMKLSQAVGIIMGANIGTTVTGWLVSSVEWAEFLSPSKMAPVAVIAGVIVMLTGKRRSTKDISAIIIGFGLLFIGITTMSDAVKPLQEYEGFVNLFATLGKSPVLGILTGAVVTAVIQSSSASVGILQSLAAAGLVPFSAAVYIIMGQNIGTCVTAILSSLGAKKNARTAALMHLLFNIIGTGLFSAAAIIYYEFVNPEIGFGYISQTEISMVHTFFNIGTTVILFPLSGWIIQLSKKIGHADEDEQDKSKVLLDDRILETPGIALQSTVREVARMGEIVAESLQVAKGVLFTLKEEEISFLKEEETTVDKLSAGITGYAIKLSGLQISEKEHQDVAHLLQMVSDIERISDYCENISEFAESLYEKKASFSEVGSAQLKEMFEVCVDSYQYAYEAFVEQNREKALKVIEKETQADDLEITLRSKHIKRLASNQCSTEAGIVFLDALVCLERISDHARNIAEEVLERV